MNTDSISNFSAGLLTGAGLTILTMTGGFFVSTLIVDKALQEHEQSVQSTADGVNHLRRAQKILDNDLSNRTSSPEENDSPSEDDEY